MSESIEQPTHISSLVEKLRSRLRNFVVINLQGEQIGKVEDFVLDDERQLNLVVSQLTDSKTQLLISSKLIQKIDPANKAVVVDAQKARIENLPVVESSQMQDKVEHNIDLESSQEIASLGEEVIRLLGERLIVERNKRKIGEVIVRKEIETRMVEVPVRYEKLIVEQVSPEHKQLAEINLDSEVVSNEAYSGEVPVGHASTVDRQTESLSSESKNISRDGEITVSGAFDSPKIVSLLLNAIALERKHGCKQIRIEIVVENVERQKTYQEWFDRCSRKD